MELSESADETTTTRCAVLADAGRLYGWAARGMVIADASGAGFLNQELTQAKINYLKVPVALGSHFPGEEVGDFPILVEPRNETLANRCALPMPDVVAIHFRTTEEMENYITSKMSQFGMKEVVLTVSPELFQSEQDLGALAVEQEPFSEQRLDLLEATASAHLLVKLVVSTAEGRTFLRVMSGANEKVENEFLAALGGAIAGSDLLEGTDLRSLADGLVKALSQEVRTSKSTVSPAESIEILDRVQEVINQVSFDNEEFKSSLDKTFKSLRDVVSSKRTHAPLKPGATPQTKLLFSVLISLIRPDPKDFLYWVENEAAEADVRLGVAAFTGIRNHRRRITSPKVRTNSDEIMLSRAISEAMAIGSSTLVVDEQFFPNDPPLPPTSNPHSTLVIRGVGLQRVLQGLSEDGSFTLEVTAGSLEVLPHDEVPAAGKPKASTKRGKQVGQTGSHKKPAQRQRSASPQKDEKSESPESTADGDQHDAQSEQPPMKLFSDEADQ